MVSILLWAVIIKLSVVDLKSCFFEGPEHRIGAPCRSHNYKVGSGNKEYESLCGCVNGVWSFVDVNLEIHFTLPSLCMRTSVSVSVRLCPEVKSSPLCCLSPREAC